MLKLKASCNAVVYFGIFITALVGLTCIIGGVIAMLKTDEILKKAESSELDVSSASLRAGGAMAVFVGGVVAITAVLGFVAVYKMSMCLLGTYMAICGIFGIFGIVTGILLIWANGVVTNAFEDMLQRDLRAMTNGSMLDRLQTTPSLRCCGYDGCSVSMYTLNVESAWINDRCNTNYCQNGCYAELWGNAQTVVKLEGVLTLIIGTLYLLTNMCVCAVCCKQGQKPS